MKILNKGAAQPVNTLLESVDPGSVVRFLKTFSDRHHINDIFIVNSVCNSYVPRCVRERRKGEFTRVDLKHGDKYDPRVHFHPHDHNSFGGYGVTNLRTGSLSYASGNRPIRLVDADVQYLGDK